MFEHYRQPLLPLTKFFRRMLNCVALSAVLLVATLSFGTVSFHWIEHFRWIDAFLNSVMIMTGLGLVGGLSTSTGKLFTSFYALLSTLIFFAILGILIAPLLHRLLHHLHLDVDRD
jgi:hypothetical protein